MKALVVYDSFFGNTEMVAKAIAAALATKLEVTAIKADQVELHQLSDLDLLVVGSPTRAFNPSPNTKSFIKGLSPLTGVKVAVFDTRLNVEEANSKVLVVLVKLFGYASEKMLKALQKKGGQALLPADWFVVKDSEGPLKDGELERAEAWAGSMLAALDV